MMWVYGGAPPVRYGLSGTSLLCFYSGASRRGEGVAKRCVLLHGYAHSSHLERLPRSHSHLLRRLHGPSPPLPSLPTPRATRHRYHQHIHAHCRNPRHHRKLPGSLNFNPAISAPVTVTITPLDYTFITPNPAISIKTEHHLAIGVNLASIGGFADNIALACPDLPAPCLLH